MVGNPKDNKRVTVAGDYVTEVVLEVRVVNAQVQVPLEKWDSSGMPSFLTTVCLATHSRLSTQIRIASS